jgi:hypothetical protein
MFTYHKALLLSKLKLEIAEREAIKQYFLTIAEIPNTLLNPLGRNSEDKKKNIEEFSTFLMNSNKYAAQVERTTKAFMYAYGFTKKVHYDIDTICINESLPTLIGMDFQQFVVLFDKLSSSLCIAFPKSPLTVNSAEISTSNPYHNCYCSIRMKLFLTLFRLKNACSFSFLSGLFGWSSSAIQAWYDLTIQVMYEELKHLHINIISYLNQRTNYEYQINEAEAWRLNKILHQQFNNYRYRVMKQITDCDKSHNLDMDPDNMLGSLGAVDGTYSIRPSTVNGQPTLDENDPEGSDRMYSDYIKQHAYKLLVLCLMVYLEDLLN